MRTVSVCIPTFNRYEMLLQSFNDILNDERVNEIVISDDASDLEIYNKVKDAVADVPKIKLFRNDINLDCYRNKHKAVSLATNSFCVLLDSDNILGRDYLDKLYEFNKWYENVIYAPDWAKPQFDYRKFSGLTIKKYNVAQYMDRNLFSTALNTCNFFVNRNEYLRIWKGDIDPVTSDSIYFNYLWLAAGNKIHFVDSMSYFHRVHNLSHYQNNVHRTPNGFHQMIEEKLKEMK